MLGHLGPMLGHLEAMLDPSREDWGAAGASMLGHLKAILGHLEVMLGLC